MLPAVITAKMVRVPAMVIFLSKSEFMTWLVRVPKFWRLFLYPEICGLNKNKRVCFLLFLCVVNRNVETK